MPQATGPVSQAMSTVPQAVSMTVPPTAAGFGPSFAPSAVPEIRSPIVSAVRTKSGPPPRRRSNTVLVAAAGSAAIAAALGIWIYIKNKDGQPTVAVHVPDGSTVEIVPDGTPSGTAPLPSGTAPSGTGLRGTDPINFFLPPAGTPVATATPSSTSSGSNSSGLHLELGLTKPVPPAGPNHPPQLRALSARLERTNHHDEHHEVHLELEHRRRRCELHLELERRRRCRELHRATGTSPTPLPTPPGTGTDLSARPRRAPRDASPPSTSGRWAPISKGTTS